MLATPELTTICPPPRPLGQLVSGWLRTVPLYSKHPAEVEGPDGGLSSEALEKLPSITKRDIKRDFPENFLGPDADIEDMVERGLLEVEHTSGTSEPRIPLLLGAGWWAEQEERALRLNRHVAGLLDETPNARRATINSPMCSNDICYTGVPSRAQRTVGNSLYLSLSRLPFLWSGQDLARMAREALEWEPLFLDVDPVYGVVFARYCEQHGIRLPSVRFILTSYEYVSMAHRRVLERVFHAPVYNLYGSTETGHLLMETEDGVMRPQRETALLQIANEDRAGVGDLMVTTLTNHYMPLVRYQIGDLVRKGTGDSMVVHGRAADAVLRPDGGRATVWDVDQCFEGIEGAAHYQLVESTDRNFQVRYVQDGPGLSAGLLGTLRERLADCFGAGARVSIEAAELLMPENSGKFRLCYPLGA